MQTHILNEQWVLLWKQDGCCVWVLYVSNTFPEDFQMIPNISSQSDDPRLRKKVGISCFSPYLSAGCPNPKLDAVEENKDWELENRRPSTPKSARAHGCEQSFCIEFTHALQIGCGRSRPQGKPGITPARVWAKDQSQCVIKFYKEVFVGWCTPHSQSP